MTFAEWYKRVCAVLAEINMRPDDWPEYDFQADYNAGIEPARSARKANAFWWGTE